MLYGRFWHIIFVVLCSGTILFWAIAVGIVLGAGQLPLAVIGSALVGGMILVFSSRKMGDIPYILLVNCRDEAVEKAAKDKIDASTKKNVLKSKSVSAKGVELNYELRVKNNDTSFLNTLLSYEGVSHAVLVTYNGEYMS